MRIDENAHDANVGNKVSKMNIQQHTYRVRAAMALHRLVGGPARERHVPDLPVAIEIPHARLIVTTGDNERTLDPAALRPVALRTGWSLLATWVDPLISGHRFVIDAVLVTENGPHVLPELRLLITQAGKRFLVPEDDGETRIAVDSTGLQMVHHQPVRTVAEQLLGLAAGQAHLHQQIYAGSPYATPLNRNIGR